MNKYYTPDIIEFYVGFEYEFKYKIHGWSAHIYNIRNGVGTHHTLEFIEKSINNNTVRVKYLSKECIEETGFEFKGNYTFLKDKYPSAVYFENKDDFKIIINKDFINENGIWLIICNEQHFEGHHYYGFAYKGVFEGYVKNKSSLKNILKMLNINNGE